MNVRLRIHPPIWALVFLGVSTLAASPLLYFQDGDVVPGEIQEIGESGHLSWKAPFFKEPLSVPTAHIDSIQFPSSRIQFPKGEGVYQVITVQGDNLHGQLLSITPEQVRLETKRHGLVTLKRGHVARLQHLQGHWLHSSANKSNWALGGWYRKIGQQLSTNIRNAKVSDTFVFQQPFHFHIQLSFTSQPKFLLSLAQQGGALKPGVEVAVETWDDHLVLILNKQFTSLGKLGEGRRQIDLHLYVAPALSFASVYDGEFKPLGSLEGKPGPKSEKFDFRLQNRADSMTIEKLDVTKWHGKPPPVSGSSAMVVGADGNSIHGHLHTFDAKEGTLFLPGRPIEKSVFFSSATFRPVLDGHLAPDGLATLVFNDTTRITGKIEALTRSLARVRIRASKDPIQCNLSDVTSIQWNNPPLPTEKEGDAVEDLLAWDKGYLQGAIIPTGEPESPLAWKPGFGGAPIPLDFGATYSIERGGFMRVPYENKDYPAMLHLSNRMEIPAKIEGYSPGKLTISSPILPGKHELPNTRIRAVRFPGKDKTYIGKGIWSLHDSSPDRVKAKGEEVFVTGKTLFYARPNPRSVLDFEIQDLRESQFEITISNPVTLHGYGINLGTDPPSPFVKIRKQANDRDFRVIKVDKHNHRETHYVYSRRRTTAKVQLVFDESIRIKVNGDSQSVLDYNPDNPVALHILPQGPGQGLELESRELSRATIAFPAPADLAKTLALPRLVAKSPPPNILTAHNGDILRGQLLRIVGDRLEFRSMKRRLNLPVERCSGILWMSPPGSGDSPAIPQEVARVVFSNGLTLPITPTRFSDGQLLGTSQTLGECQAPFDSITTFHFGKSGQLEPLPTFVPWKYTVNTVSHQE